MPQAPQSQLCNCQGSKQIINNNQLPLVSIAMPVHNCAPTLGIAVRSILNQTFSHWELLVLDDGSTDGTVSCAQAFSDPRVRIYADGTHRGLVARLNQGIETSRGKYFARMDGDDVSYPDRLLRQVSYMEKHGEVDLLGGGVLVFGRNGHALGTREIRITHEHICRRPLAGFYLPHPTWFGRTQWFRKHLYRSDAVRSEDQELLLRTYESSRFACLPEIVLGYKEDVLSLRKIFVGRRSFTRAATQRAMSNGRYGLAMAVAIEQSLKAFVECVAISTGLDHHVLRHRARPMELVMKRRWTEVWEQVHEKAHFGAFPLIGNSQ